MLRCSTFAEGSRAGNGSESVSRKSAIYPVLARQSDAERNGYSGVNPSIISFSLASSHSCCGSRHAAHPGKTRSSQ